MLIGNDGNLCVQVLSETDIEAILGLVAMNHGLRWFEWWPTAEGNRKVIAESAENFAAGKGFYAGIRCEDILTGVIGLWHTDTWNAHAWLGYWLGRDYHGRGYVTRASRLVIRYAVETMGLHRIEVPIATGNLKSRTVVERLGLTEEGILRKACRLIPGVHDIADFPADSVEQQGDRQFYDVVMYSLLESDPAYERIKRDLTR